MLHLDGSLLRHRFSHVSQWVIYQPTSPEVFQFRKIKQKAATYYISRLCQAKGPGEIQSTLDGLGVLTICAVPSPRIVGPLRPVPPSQWFLHIQVLSLRIRPAVDCVVLWYLPLEKIHKQEDPLSSNPGCSRVNCINNKALISIKLSVYLSPFLFYQPSTDHHQIMGCYAGRPQWPSVGLLIL